MNNLNPDEVKARLDEAEASAAEPDSETAAQPDYLRWCQGLSLRIDGLERDRDELAAEREVLQRSPNPGPGINLDATFTYHPPIGSQLQRYKTLREMARVFAHAIQDRCPASAERTLAIRHLQQAVMFANAAIAIHEIDPAVARFAAPYSAP